MSFNLPSAQLDERYPGLMRREGATAAECSDSGRRATDFIMGRLGEPLSIQRVARASGLSARTLHRIIRREHGVSPMVLLRRARLEKVRQDLQAPRPETTVTGTAFHWGFTHLGRFSAGYARAFGEVPSDTLRRARRRSMAPATGSNRTAPAPSLAGPGIIV